MSRVQASGPLYFIIRHAFAGKQQPCSSTKLGLYSYMLQHVSGSSSTNTAHSERLIPWLDGCSNTITPDQ